MRQYGVMTHGDETRSAEQRLEDLEAELHELQRKHDLAADGNERSDGHHHPAEAATDAEMREHDLRLQTRAKERIDHIERALKAIKDGTYGVCVDCEKPIPAGRLRAVPDAQRCVPCQSKADRTR